MTNLLLQYVHKFGCWCIIKDSSRVAVKYPQSWKAEDIREDAREKAAQMGAELLIDDTDAPNI